MERLLRLPEVRQAVGLGTTAIYDAMRKGGFPRSVLIGERAVAWRESDVLTWIGDRATTSADPYHCVRSDARPKGHI